MGNFVDMTTDVSTAFPIKTEFNLFKHQLEVDAIGDQFCCGDDIRECIKIYYEYTENFKLKSIFEKTIEHLNQTYYPLKFQIRMINELFGTSVTLYSSEDISSIMDKSITQYSQTDIEKHQISIDVEVKYEQKIVTNVSCPTMRNVETESPLQCPIYKQMLKQYDLNEEHLKHLEEHNHFTSEYEQKPKCRYNDDCKAYIRQENGGNRLDDRCHMKLYRHPPRRRNIQLNDNINAMILNKKDDDNHKLYEPTDDDEEQYDYDEQNGFLKALIGEVINNGYQSDLCLECSQNDECKHDKYSILQIVDDKMKHYRHKAISEPL
eukprot:534339_1